MFPPAIDKPIGRKITCGHCGRFWHARIEGRDPIICPKCLCYYYLLPIDIAPCKHNPTHPKYKKPPRHRRPLWSPCIWNSISGGRGRSYSLYFIITA